MQAMKPVAWDSWAFIETALRYSRKDEVQRSWNKAEVIVTSRDILGEVFTYIQGRSQKQALARQWLEAAMHSRVRIVDPSFEAVAEYILAHPEAHGLSWQDMSLAYVADQAGSRSIATQDKEFQRLGFATLFSSDLPNRS